MSLLIIKNWKIILEIFRITIVINYIFVTSLVCFEWK